MPSKRLAGAELNPLLASPFVRGRVSGTDHDYTLRFRLQRTDSEGRSVRVPLRHPCRSGCSFTSGHVTIPRRADPRCSRNGHRVIQPCCAATAAIQISFSGMGRPLARKSSLMRPYCRAVASSHPRDCHCCGKLIDAVDVRLEACRLASLVVEFSQCYGRHEHVINSGHAL